MTPRQKILVIDDSVLIHRLLGARLRELNVEMLYAVDGQQGLQLARTVDPDLVLLEIHVPGMNGFDVCRSLKADPKTHDIPVIIITAADKSVDKVLAFDLGAVDYIVKPFDPTELRARVRAALNTKALMDMLTSQAQIDGLTGLHNRRYFDNRLAEELAAASRHATAVGLLLLDIDNFKHINDEYGHPKGDQIARRFASILRSACRVYDVPCRYGGDEFAMILPRATRRETGEIGHRLVELIHGDVELRALVPTRITASLGAASAEAGEIVTPDQLLTRADEALYISKQSGRDRFTLAAATAA